MGMPRFPQMPRAIQTAIRRVFAPAEAGLSVEKTGAPKAQAKVGWAPTVERPASGLGAIRGTLSGDLSALRSQAKAIRAEMDRITQDLNASKADVARLSGLAIQLEAARAAARAAVSDARKERKAEFEVAKGIVDTHFAEIEKAVGPEGAALLERKRKTLLTRLARAAIADAHRTGGGKPRRKQKTVDSVLDHLRDELLKTASEGGHGAINSAIGSLRTELADRQSAMTKRQKRMLAERNAATACEKKKGSLHADIARSTDAISKSERRLRAIKPRLAAIEAQIIQVQKSIALIDSITQAIEVNEEVAEESHRERMDELSEARRDEQARDLEQLTESLEAAAEQAKAAVESDGYVTQSRNLDGAIASAREALRRSGNNSPAAEAALETLAGLLSQQAGAESNSASLDRRAADEIPDSR